MGADNGGLYLRSIADRAYRYSCDGKVYAAGYNRLGRLGLGDDDDRPAVAR